MLLIGCRKPLLLHDLGLNNRRTSVFSGVLLGFTVDLTDIVIFGLMNLIKMGLVLLEGYFVA